MLVFPLFGQCFVNFVSFFLCQRELRFSSQENLWWPWGRKFESLVHSRLHWRNARSARAFTREYAMRASCDPRCEQPESPSLFYSSLPTSYSPSYEMKWWWWNNEMMMMTFWVLYFFGTFICYRGCLNLKCYISKKVQKNFLIGLKIWWSWGSDFVFVFFFWNFYM